MAVTLFDLVNMVKEGNFPEEQLGTEERLTIMNGNLMANYTIIMAHCLLNEIPQENAEVIYNKRKDLYDRIMVTVNMYNNGRTGRLVEELEKVTQAAEDDKVLWPSKKLRNNVLLFATQYFIWDDRTRAIFFGIDVPEMEPVRDQVGDPEQIIDGSEA